MPHRFFSWLGRPTENALMANCSGQEGRTQQWTKPPQHTPGGGLPSQPAENSVELTVAMVDTLLRSAMMEAMPPRRLVRWTVSPFVPGTGTNWLITLAAVASKLFCRAGTARHGTARHGKEGAGRDPPSGEQRPLRNVNVSPSPSSLRYPVVIPAAIPALPTAHGSSASLPSPSPHHVPPRGWQRRRLSSC